MSGDPQTKPVWPPVDRPATPPTHRESPVRTRAGRWSWVAELEDAWLDTASPPIGDRIADAGWSPDGPDAYCPRCGSDTGPFEADADGCRRCRDRRLRWDAAVRLGAYEGLLRELVLETKYSAWRRLGAELG